MVGVPPVATSTRLRPLRVDVELERFPDSWGISERPRLLDDDRHEFVRLLERPQIDVGRALRNVYPRGTSRGATPLTAQNAFSTSNARRIDFIGVCPGSYTIIVDMHKTSDYVRRKFVYRDIGAVRRWQQLAIGVAARRVANRTHPLQRSQWYYCNYSCGYCELDRPIIRSVGRLRLIISDDLEGYVCGSSNVGNSRRFS